MYLKYFGIFALFVIVRGSALPTVVDSSEPVAIVSKESEMSPDGNFKWSFESADGTKAEQVAEVKTIEKDIVVEDIHGSYSYVDPEGKTHTLQYTANEHGFIPKGDDILPEIASHLAYIEQQPVISVGSKHDK